jgi:Ca2+-binding EF-hand superfamily protein
MKTHLRKFGLLLSDEDLRTFFENWDKDGNGLIDFNEFIHGVLPTDYPKGINLGSTKSGTTLFGPSDLTVTATGMGHRPLTADPESTYSKLHNAVIDDWTNDQMEAMVRQKVCERGHSSKDLLSQAFALFGRPQGGLDYACFRSTLLRKFGLPFKEEQIRRLHHHYDKNGSGFISFHEFICHVMPQDYTSDSHWQHGEESNHGSMRKPNLDAFHPRPPYLSVICLSICAS